MVFQLVLHFVLKEDKLQTTPVTVKGLVDLKHRQFPRSLQGAHIAHL